MEIILQDSTFREFCELIYEKMGIRIPPTKKYLVENRLFKVVEDFNLKGYEEYLYMIKYNPNGRGLERLYDAITTNETYFFREPQQFDVFIDRVVPKIMERKRPFNDIRVWSAACSSGDEPYTLAILMKEKRPNVRAEILASDISSRVLESARRGVYSSYSIRNVEQYYVEKYFKKEDPDYVLDRSVLAPVKFMNINLVEERKIPELKDFDVIFCRNVLIYFDDKAKQKAVSFLYDNLRPGGFLFIGSSESLHNVTRAFKPVTIDKVVVYEKV